MSGFFAFFRATPPKAVAPFSEQRFRFVRWQTFLAMTVAYVTFYVCACRLPLLKARSLSSVLRPPSSG
ncbi:Uncharacterised protein [Raoultella terrigena]|uniref:Glycerol-3-phosphate transporter n=1 Tax=Raoultella terrigena TaxID=577 RepID=A0A7Z8ZEL6_RAOTE|nr:Uncharacterised protein [Raoultella terrigena]